MGILDKIFGGKDKPPEKAPDFSGVRTGGGSTLGERAPASPPTAGAPLPPPSTTPGSAPATAAQTYEVQPGDSLSKIAKRFYGDANDWPRIHEANRDQIKNPDLIYPGQKLRIP